jgi:hypothetical protein
MELSKTVALTAFLFIVVLILTSGNTIGAERSREPVKANEATFERSRTSQAGRPAGTEYAPPKRTKKTSAAKQATAPVKPCQYKPVMTAADMRACKRK